MRHSVAINLLQAACDEEIREAGQIVRCRVSLVLANDITAPLAIKSFRQMGAAKVFDRTRIALVMDHFTPNKDVASAEQVRGVREFAKEMDILHYFEGGDCGVEHALLPELGLAGPGDVIVGADSHTCTYGGLGAFATGMGSTDIAAAMALGETWFKVPQTILVRMTGTLQPHVGPKDLILKVIGITGVDGARYKALEFGGPVAAAMSMEGRMTMANMAIEAGGKAGLFPADAKALAYAKAAGHAPSLAGQAEIHPGPDAVYEEIIELDATALPPQVACPHLPENVRGVDELAPQHIRIDQSVIGSCTNGRIEDLREAAAILKGRRVAKTVRCVVLPATPRIWTQALREGLLETFMESGCIVGPPTCGPCLGGHMGILARGERAIATTNRNFKGRMGHLDSEVYLASPALAAAAAIAGEIVHPASL